MIYTFIAERCSDLPVSVCCRVMKVSTSGFYQRLATPVTDAELDEARRANVVFDIWKRSRHSYGMPRIRNEFRQGRHQPISRTTTARLMRLCGAVGIHYRRRGGCTRPGDGEVSDDLANRAFDPDGPDRLWCMDITEHPTGEGKVYLAVVLDAFSRRVIGWSIADHMRAELVADALQMATWRRQPPAGQTIAHADHGGQGELNRSSQHLDRGGVQRWQRCGSGSGRRSCIGGRSRLRAHRRWRGARTVCGSGRRSPVA
jgi:hypothetical protein